MCVVEVLLYGFEADTEIFVFDASVGVVECGSDGAYSGYGRGALVVEHSLQTIGGLGGEALETGHGMMDDLAAGAIVFALKI